MRHRVVQFSGGIGSWAAARIVRDNYPDDPITLLFADTLIEDEETYRFLEAAAADIGVPVTRVADGRTPWELFKDEGFLANARVDICSRVLKRDLLRSYIEEHFDPATATIYLGIDWTEVHRLERARPRWEPWRIEAPLTETTWKPGQVAHFTKDKLLEWAEQRGLPKQRLYKMGMPHANCGGACVKAGQGHFAQLFEVFPERFAEWERNEQEVIDHIGKPVAILRDRRGGDSRPLPLGKLRARLEGKDEAQVDLLDFGGCGCGF